jgi:hypothetical protein
MLNETDYFVGSANVFADLGYPRPEEGAGKAEFARLVRFLVLLGGDVQIVVKVQGIAAIAARGVEAFGLCVERRSSRPGLQRSEALGLLEKLLRLGSVLTGSGLTQDDRQGHKTRAPNQRDDGARGQGNFPRW